MYILITLSYKVCLSGTTRLSIWAPALHAVHDLVGVVPRPVARREPRSMKHVCLVCVHPRRIFLPQFDIYAHISNACRVPCHQGMPQQYFVQPCVPKVVAPVRDPCDCDPVARALVLDVRQCGFPFERIETLWAMGEIACIGASDGERQGLDVVELILTNRLSKTNISDIVGCVHVSSETDTHSKECTMCI